MAEHTNALRALFIRFLVWSTRLTETRSWSCAASRTILAYQCGRRIWLSASFTWRRCSSVEKAARADSPRITNATLIAQATNWVSLSVPARWALVTGRASNLALADKMASQYFSTVSQWRIRHEVLRAFAPGVIHVGDGMRPAGLTKTEPRCHTASRAIFALKTSLFIRLSAISTWLRCSIREETARADGPVITTATPCGAWGASDSIIACRICVPASRAVVTGCPCSRVRAGHMTAKRGVFTSQHSCRIRHEVFHAFAGGARLWVGDSVRGRGAGYWPIGHRSQRLGSGVAIIGCTIEDMDP